VRTASLVDELGIITHIFTDKTGTLTQNVMQFRKASSLYVEYAEREKEYSILFIFSLYCEHIQLECVLIHVIYRVN